MTKTLFDIIFENHTKLRSNKLQRLQIDRDNEQDKIIEYYSKHDIDAFIGDLYGDIFLSLQKKYFQETFNGNNLETMFKHFIIFTYTILIGMIIGYLLTMIMI